MRHLLVILLCVGVGLWAGGTAQAQKPDQVAPVMKYATPQSMQLNELARQLSSARKAGDVDRTRNIESQISGMLASTPEGIGAGTLTPRPANHMTGPAGVASWGANWQVYAGNLRYGSRREIALDADTLGNVFCAVNAISGDTGSAIRVFKSTDAGYHWTLVNGFVYSADIVQSIDMCVTDTLAGKWLIALVWVAQSRVADKGGYLYWGSMLDDGSSWRYKLIATATAGTAYRNPAICSDGKYYSPAVTYHYVAAEYVTPLTGDSRGLAVTRTVNWGNAWSALDTTIRGFKEGTPSIAIDWSSSPDSLLIAFSRTFTATDADIRVAKNSLTFSSPWTITYPVTTNDLEYDPAFALDPLTGTGMVSYTRDRNNTGNLDVFYAYSPNRFGTFTIDSIATSPSVDEELSAVCQAPYNTPTQSAWRAVYRTGAGGGSIVYKWQFNQLGGLGLVAPQTVSHHTPSGVLVPALSAIKYSGATYTGMTAYPGFGPTDVWFDGAHTSVDKLDGPVPEEYVLEQNFPNPFNPATVIPFSVPERTHVTLKVYDIMGREVATLANGQMDAGRYTASFDASHCATGMYVYRLTAGKFSLARKMVLTK